ncbi:ORF6N domain-containing protein [Hafnia paralvei]|uniref:ORF6N domain-containing protein n=1 Tax=Hafnia paralvei TaxID=546367 RepID=UPI000DF275EF|nr:ORF6N domain-containing protein [Hafnia paralvei]RDA68363.1 ORF6N domain-containing protein [Hafnia paralvei]RDA69402.1 ORF6N domain-containing protein [Hafnia paralvei]RDA69563.1 ORF6N domain-containing protein [Hafnia paralvei]RDA79606.1 ORF6N domain-containing protein [Hafnia paralvei]RDA80144.1 ORF6N domain-containing protein [Hafnia paralvei]
MTTRISIEALSPITHNQIPVVTTELLANLYGTDTANIKKNYSRNKDRFVEGKHYFLIKGEQLRELKNSVTSSHQVDKRTPKLTLWTERGAARHAKMLETDQAWEVFEKLEDCYFSQKTDSSEVTSVKPQTHTITLSDEEFCSLCYLWSTADKMRTDARKLYPILVDLGSKYAGRFYDIGYEFNYTLNNAQKALARESMRIEHQQRISQNWQRILPHLRDVKH